MSPHRSHQGARQRFIAQEQQWGAGTQGCGGHWGGDISAVPHWHPGVLGTWGLGWGTCRGVGGGRGTPLALGTLRLLGLAGRQLLHVLLGRWPRPLEETRLEEGHGDNPALGHPMASPPGDPTASPPGDPMASLLVLPPTPRAGSPISWVTSVPLGSYQHGGVSPVSPVSLPPPHILTFHMRRMRRVRSRSPARTPSTTHHTGTAPSPPGLARTTLVTACGGTGG